MGGFGSGNRNQWPQRGLVENHDALDVRALHREDALNPGSVTTLTWGRGSNRKPRSILVVAGRDSIELRYTVTRFGHKPERIAQPVRLDWTPCHFGGQRPWFLCGGIVNGRLCLRRVAILYNGGRYFLCRHCYDFTYESTRADESLRKLRKAQKIRRRLGGSASIVEPYPVKPKGMHWQTYWRLIREAHHLEEQYLASTILETAELLSRFPALNDDQ